MAFLPHILFADIYLQDEKMTILSAPIYGHLWQCTKSFYQSNMYFITLIRMMLLWLVLIARCSGSDVIPLDRAEQCSTLNSVYSTAANAIDNQFYTWSATTEVNPAWWRVYFTSSSEVGRVVVEKGMSISTACVWTVSVYDGEVQTVCGSYTGKLYG